VLLGLLALLIALGVAYWLLSLDHGDDEQVIAERSVATNQASRDDLKPVSSERPSNSEPAPPLPQPSKSPTQPTNTDQLDPARTTIDDAKATPSPFFGTLIFRLDEGDIGAVRVVARVQREAQTIRDILNDNAIIRYATHGDTGLYSTNFPNGSFSARFEFPRHAHHNRDFVIRAGETTDLGTFDLKPSPTLTGRVLMANGLPVAGATVIATRTGDTGTWRVNHADMYPWIQTTIATSNDDGRFTAYNMPPDVLSITATHGGLVATPAIAPLAQFGVQRDVTVIMSAGGRLTGTISGITVTAAQATPSINAGQPELAPAIRPRVDTSWPTWLRMIRVDSPAAAGVVAGDGIEFLPTLRPQEFFDVDNGPYATEPVAPGEYFVTLRVGSEMATRRVTIHDGANAVEDWEFGQVGTIVGTVTLSDGEPVSGVTVYFATLSEKSRYDTGLPDTEPYKGKLGETKTDADGRYRLQAGPGVWEVRVREHDKLIPVSPIPVFGARVLSSRETRCDIQINDSELVEVSVRVTTSLDFRGLNVQSPVEFRANGYSVNIKDALPNSWANAGKLPPGDYDVLIYPRGSSHESGLVTLYLQLRLTVPRGVSEYHADIRCNGHPVNGVVLDAEDMPVKGVMVRVHSQVWGMSSAEVDDQGRFTIAWVGEGVCFANVSKGIQVISPSYTRFTVPTTEPLVLRTATRTGTALVRIRSRAGEPVKPGSYAGCSVYNDRGDPLAMTSSSLPGPKFGQVGSAKQMREIPVGPVTITVFVSGFVLATHTIEILADRETTVEVDLIPAAWVRVWLPKDGFTTRDLASLTLDNAASAARRAQTDWSGVRNAEVTIWKFQQDPVTGQHFYEGHFEPLDGQVTLTCRAGGRDAITWSVPVGPGESAETVVPGQ